MSIQPSNYASTGTFSRRSLLAGVVALGAFGGVVPVMAQPATPPESQAEGDADAVAVLQAAGDAVLALDTFEFTMETIAGQSTILPSVELVSVQGKVRRPIDIEAKLKVKALMQTMEASAVGVDGEFYLQNPLDGSWMSMGSASEVATMINPDWILTMAINQIKDAKITSDGNDQTLIEGHVNLFETLSDVGGQGAEMEQMKQFLAEGPVDVAFWINKDNLIERAEIYGPIFSAESPDVEKRIELSRFNEPVEIEVPAMN